MAEFITMEQAEDKFGKKGISNAGLSLGIIGTALAAFGGNGLGGLFGGNSGANGITGPTAYQVEQKECQDAIDLTKAIYDQRIKSMTDDFDLYTRLNARIVELEKKDAQLETALPLTFQLAQCHSERYTDDKAWAQSNALNAAVLSQTKANAALEAQILMRPVGKVALPFSDLITSCPSLPKIIYQTKDCGCGCGSTTEA